MRGLLRGIDLGHIKANLSLSMEVIQVNFEGFSLRPENMWQVLPPRVGWGFSVALTVQYLHPQVGSH